MGLQVAFCVLNLLSGILHAAPTGTSSSNDSLPTVDLGYEKHAAIEFNAQGHFYNFSNIPYAAPPVGELRFDKPHPPPQTDGVNRGETVKICPQASASYGQVVEGFALAYFEAGGDIAAVQTIVDNGTLAAEAAFLQSNFTFENDPAEDEDCLYLDVVVPRDIFEGNEKAPVLVEIYGGGYTAGQKNFGNVGSPDGLLARSNDSIIYVTMNYRLGAFGWLAGKSFNEAGGVSNAGLHDQRFALEWVQKYIHLFGGDCAQVTVIGESAGGGSIMHQITAYGGKGKAPFQRAIPQSPGFGPIDSANYTETAFQSFLRYANVSSLAEAKQLTRAQLLEANQRQIWEAPVIGSAVYGPVVDGDFVPALPGVLLANGSFYKDIEIMAGHNTNEGYLFTSPFTETEEGITSTLTQSIPGIQPDEISYILNTLYPPVYDSTLPYRNWYDRASLITTEFAFTCNDYYMVSALPNTSYGYEFGIPPALHGQDVLYTFYTGFPINKTQPYAVNNVEVAYTLQDWIVTFTLGGSPTTVVPGAPDLPVWGEGMDIGLLNTTYLPLQDFAPGIIKDNTANARCQWWQQAKYVHS